MQNEDQIFLSNEPLPDADTSITLDIVSGGETTRGPGEPLPQKKTLEGKITLNPQSCQIYALSSVAETGSLRAAWDFYFVIMPFTLHEAPGHNYYQNVTFFIELLTPGVTAFDLFPKNLTRPIDSTTFYSVSSTMRISKVEANAPGKLIHFDALQPRITSYGEGEQSFYWTYQGSREQKEVAQGTRHALIVLRVPHGTRVVDGTISYEIVIAKNLLGLWRTVDSEVVPYPIRWQLGETVPSFFHKRGHSGSMASSLVQSNSGEDGQKKRLNLFYAYAPEDENLRRELEKHLSTLRRDGWIQEWRAHDVEAGRPIAEIGSFLERSQIILLLISPDFLASDPLYKQVEAALKMQEKQGARVVPILLRATGGWEDTPLGKLVVLPRNKKPVDKWSNRDDAFKEIASEIKEIISKNYLR
jgi:TIR domain